MLLLRLVKVLDSERTRKEVTKGVLIMHDFDRYLSENHVGFAYQQRRTEKKASSENRSGVVMYQNSTDNYKGLKTVTATFGIIVAGVIAYYFGQKPAQNRAHGAEEITPHTSTTSKESASKTIKEIDSEIEYGTQISEFLETIKRLDIT